MQIYDQLQRSISFVNTPSKIVSLVPSQTELLVDLGLEDLLVGITKFCVHPTRLRKEKNIVGGTKSVKLEKIKELQPDIILCNKEENTKEMVKALEKIAPTHVSDIYNLEDVYEMMQQYGQLFSVEDKARAIVKNIQSELKDFQETIQNKPVKKVAYFIWKDPWMVAGRSTFINKLLQLNKFKNVYEDLERYPELSIENLREVDYVLLSSEPFPFKEKHIAAFEEFVPKEKIIFVDGEFFSWYGSRLQSAFYYFKNLHFHIK